MPSLNRFLSRSPRLYPWRAEGARPGAPGNGAAVLMAARSLCRFRAFARPDGASDAKQRAALALRIREWAPFDQADHISVDIAGHHLVWAWDARAAQAALTALGLRPGRTKVLPETLFQEPMAEGLRLIAGLEGVEGQVWRGGALVESRYWAEAPDERAWIAFQRGAGLRPEAMAPRPPEPSRVAWLERPWGGGDTSPLALLDRLEPRDLAAVLALAAAAPLIFLGAERLRVQSDLSAANGRIAALEASAGPVIEARGQAFAAVDRIQTLLNLDPYPPQITILARVAQALPNDGTRLVDWLYQNGDLEFGLSSPNPLDARTIVERFENAGLFTGVSVDRTNSQIQKLRMKVLPRAKIAAQP